MLKLYDYFRSSACFRVRIALNIKKLAYEIFPIHLVNQGGEQFSAAYQLVNPHSLIPALQENDDVMTQSLAIIEYLDEAYPSPALLPKNLVEKARARSFALSIVADIHPLNNLRVLNYLTHHFNMVETQKNQWYQHWVEKGLIALEKQLVSYHTSTDFCFGTEPTLADICLVPQIYNARRFSCNLSACPTLVRIDKNCQQHPAFIKAWPKEPVV